MLAGVVVLDLGVSAAARFAARILADCGARVIALPADGRAAPDPGSGWWHSLSKEVLSSAADTPELRSLLRLADVVIDDWQGGRASHAFFASLESVNPKAVHLTLSPFGLDGPYGDSTAMRISPRR